MMAWGHFVRFDGLESRPLSVDEYYSVTGVQYILEKGVPVFPTGGYYLRAWPLQYLQGRVRPPEARAANMLLFGRSRGLAHLPNDVSTCRTGAVIDHGAREGPTRDHRNQC
jgi:hypothetical protein